MKPRIFAAALLLAPMAASAQTRAASDKLQAFQERLRADCAAGRFSGVMVVVKSGREVVKAACGTADETSGAKIDLDSRFKLFSASKLLTALAVMSMVERHEMELDTSIADYVPDVPHGWRGATIRQLLQHTSGIPDLTSPQLLDAFRTSHPAAMRRVLAQASRDKLPLLSKPGETWRYNNFGYELLADAAARKAGMPFAEVLRKRVFVPAGMKSAVVETATLVRGKRTAVKDPRLVKGYNGSPGALEPAESYSFVQLGAGAVHATAADMLALARAIGDGRIVSLATWRMMTEPAKLRSPDDKPGAGYGLGVSVRDAPGVRRECHDGGNNGYVADFCRFPKQGGVWVLLSNRGYVNVGEWRKAASELITAD